MPLAPQTGPYCYGSPLSDFMTDRAVLRTLAENEMAETEMHDAPMNGAADSAYSRSTLNMENAQLDKPRP